MAIRLDKGYTEKAERLSNGILKAPAFVTRVGVFTYKRVDGSVSKELRLPSEVFNKDSMESLRLIPVCNEHPPELINAKNAKKYAVGTTGEIVEQVDKYVKTNLMVYDEAAISDIDAGKQECSCGYTCDLEEKSGVYDGESFDRIQRNIRYNHVATVKKGRAGDNVRLHLDSQDAILIEDETQTQRSDTMKIKLGAKEFDVSEEIGKAFHEHMSQAKKDMEEELEKKYKAKGTEDCKNKDSADVETLKAKVDMLQNELKTKTDAMSDSVINEKVNKRIRILETAKKVVKEGAEKIDSLSDIEIMKTVIKTDSKEINLDGKSDEYVTACFDMICDKQKRIEENLKKTGKFVADSEIKNDGLFGKKDEDNQANPEEARKKSMELDSKAYKR